MLVGIGDGAADLSKKREPFTNRQVISLTVIIESRAIDILHGEEGLAVGYPRVVESGDVWMIQGREDALFVAKMPDDGAPTEASADQLERHFAVEAHIFREIDHSHSAFTNERFDLVMLHTFTRRKSLLVVQVTRQFWRRLLKKFPACTMMKKKRFQLGTQLGVVRAGALEKGLPLTFVTLDRFLEERGDLLGAPFSHWRAPPSIDAAATPWRNSSRARSFWAKH